MSDKYLKLYTLFLEMYPEYILPTKPSYNEWLESTVRFLAFSREYKLVTKVLGYKHD